MNNIDLAKYENLALLGNEEAIFMLANYYQDEGNYVKAFSYLTRMINTNNPMYLRKIGYFFEKGLGVETSKQTAFSFYLKSADLGDSISQYNVSICYLNGVGVEKNEDLAYKYAYKSAKQKYEKAIILFANFLRNGIGCEKDLTAAFQCLNNCNNDNGDVLYLKSLILLDKDWHSNDKEHAKKLLERGSILNNLKCMILLADCYVKGTLDEKDESKSLSLLLKAAKIGSGEAMHKLADYYHLGIGTTKNDDIADFWEKEALKIKK